MVCKHDLATRMVIITMLLPLTRVVYLIDRICLASSSCRVQTQLHQLPILVELLGKIILGCLQGGPIQLTLPVQHCTAHSVLCHHICFAEPCGCMVCLGVHNNTCAS